MKFPKILISLLVVLIIPLALWGSFLLGTRQNSSNEISDVIATPTPTQSIEQTFRQCTLQDIGARVKANPETELVHITSRDAVEKNTYRYILTVSNAFVSGDSSNCEADITEVMNRVFAQASGEQFDAVLGRIAAFPFDGKFIGNMSVVVPLGNLLLDVNLLTEKFTVVASNENALFYTVLKDLDGIQRMLPTKIDTERLALYTVSYEGIACSEGNCDQQFPDLMKKICTEKKMGIWMYDPVKKSTKQLYASKCG